MANEENLKERKGAGRPKGAPNKTTVALKTAIMNAFEKVGGEDYLEMVAREDPRTFCALLSKVLPAEMKIDGDIRTVVTTKRFGRKPKEIDNAST